MKTELSKNMQKLLQAYDKHCRAVQQKTRLSLHLSPVERQKKRKQLEQTYVEWFCFFFPQYAKAPCASFHKEMADRLIHNPVCFLLAEIYRSGAKSVHLDMGIPLYLYLTGTLRFMLCIGQTEPKAKKLLSDVQAQLTHNQRLMYFYGRRFKYGDWAEGDFSTTDGVRFTAKGFGQSPRGLRQEEQRPDYIVVDDVDTRQRVNNETLSKKAFDYVYEDVIGTFDEGAQHRRFVCANNNFHQNTVINQLKAQFHLNRKKALEDGERKTPYYIFSVPAVKDLHSFEPLWPEKTSAEYWRKKYRDTPYRSFMREYMHKHIIEGAIFKNEHIQYKCLLPLEQYDALVCYGDLSYKDAGDYKAMVLAGKKGREFHVLEAFVRQTSRHHTALWLYELVEEQQLLQYNIAYLIEGLFAQDEFVSDFNIVGDTKGWYVPVTADKKPKAAKFDRIESMAGYFERGNVWFNKERKESTDFNTLEDQLLSFAKGSGAHDDAPDSLQSALSHLNVRAVQNTVPPRMMSMKQWINKSKNRY